MCAPPVGRTVPNIAARLSGEKQVEFQAKPLRRTGGRVKGWGGFRPQHNFTLGSPSPCPLPPGERVSLARSPYAAHTAPSPLEGEGWGEGDWFTRRRGDAEGKSSPFPNVSPRSHPRRPVLEPGFGCAPSGSKKSLAPCQARGDAWGTRLCPPLISLIFDGFLQQNLAFISKEWAGLA